MEPEKKIKTIAKHFGIGVIAPALLLINAFIVPEPYSHPFIHVAIAPTKIMPFLENRELMHELTIFVFGRMTPNYAPITIVFLIIFWFFIGIIASLVLQYILGQKRMPNRVAGGF
jgi:hypothetical protein